MLPHGPFPRQDPLAPALLPHAAPGDVAVMCRLGVCGVPVKDGAIAIGYAARMRCPGSLAPLLSLAGLALSLTACPTPAPTGPTTSAVAKDSALLVLPLTESSQKPAREALDRLSDRATGGDLAAAWTRLHYLIDLFDDARFRRDPLSLQLLHEAIGSTDDGERRGAEATDRVLAELLRDADDIMGRDRMHPHAQGARTLLEFDSNPPASRVGLLTRMATLERLAQPDQPLADNARLRLLGYCRLAFQDIPKSRYADRPKVLAHCLYPLYRSDPAPYFARLAEDRPPLPRWQDLRDRWLERIEDVAAGGRRLAGAGQAERERLRETVTRNANAMPVLPPLADLALPRVRRVALYEWTPLLPLGDGSQRALLDDIPGLTRAVAGDGRRLGTVALRADAPATAVLDAAAGLVRAGADRLELAVVTSQKMKVPTGDYWHGRLQDESVDRLGVIPLSLAPYRGTANVRSSHWDPGRATLGLHLEVQAGRWVLKAPTGSVTEVATADLAAAQKTLRGVLSWLYAAFPDEDAVVVVPVSGATVDSLAHALEAVRHDAEGRELLAHVGLGRTSPTIAADSLAGRIDRRSKANVEIRPSALAVRTSVVRSCYQDVLDNDATAAGAFRLELTDGRLAITNGPKNPALRACLMTGLASMMKEQSMASAEVILTVK